MPAARSSGSSGSSRGSGRSGRSPAKRASARSGSPRTGSPRTGSPRSSSPRAQRAGGRTSSPARSSGRSGSARQGVADGVAGLAEQLTNRVIRPLDVVMLTRERIQETLDEAAERGRVTRTDANELVSELVQRGRQQTDALLADIERLVGRGRDQLGSATKRARRSEQVDLLVRGADRARRTVGVGPAFPILGYDDLSAGQVQERLNGLSAGELRQVREYERRHANRKSVLSAIEKGLS